MAEQVKEHGTLLSGAVTATTGNDILAPPVPEERPGDPVRKVADKAAAATPEDMQDALDWFLADDDSVDVPTYTVQINVSTDPEVKQWVDWVVKPIPSARIDALRRIFQVSVNREQRRRGVQAELDAAKFNAALVFEATVSPDLVKAIEAASTKFSDGSQMVMHRFRFKPLLIDQIAGQVLFYSGGDDEDMRLSREIRAAGN